jgi:hypothetical protein
LNRCLRRFAARALRLADGSARGSDLLNDRDKRRRYFQVISMPKKSTNTCRLGLFFGSVADRECRSRSAALPDSFCRPVASCSPDRLRLGPVAHDQVNDVALGTDRLT